MKGMKKWRGLRPPTKGRGKSPSAIGSMRKGTKASSALGDYEIGRRTKSKKYREVFGG